MEKILTINTLSGKSSSGLRSAQQNKSITSLRNAVTVAKSVQSPAVDEWSGLSSGKIGKDRYQKLHHVISPQYTGLSSISGPHKGRKNGPKRAWLGRNSTGTIDAPADSVAPKLYPLAGLKAPITLPRTGKSYTQLEPTKPKALSQASVRPKQVRSNIETVGTRIQDPERPLFLYEGEFLNFGPDDSAITLLETADDEIAMHFRASLFRDQNILPGERFTYAIYRTDLGSRSEIRAFAPTRPTYEERKRRAEDVRRIVEGLLTPNVD